MRAERSTLASGKWMSRKRAFGITRRVSAHLPPVRSCDSQLGNGLQMKNKKARSSVVRVCRHSASHLLRACHVAISTSLYRCKGEKRRSDDLGGRAWSHMERREVRGGRLPDMFPVLLHVPFSWDRLLLHSNDHILTGPVSLPSFRHLLLFPLTQSRQNA